MDFGRNSEGLLLMPASAGFLAALGMTAVFTTENTKGTEGFGEELDGVSVEDAWVGFFALLRMTSGFGEEL